MVSVPFEFWGHDFLAGIKDIAVNELENQVNIFVMKKLIFLVYFNLRQFLNKFSVTRRSRNPFIAVFLNLEREKTVF